MAERHMTLTGKTPAFGTSRPAWRRASGWAGLFVVVVVVVAAAAQAGLWFVPFAAGVLAGVLSLRRKHIVLTTLIGAVAGWALPLWVLALRGYPAGATARVIAAFAGLPPHAAVTIVLTLLLAALQVLVGAWLARAFAPRR